MGDACVPTRTETCDDVRFITGLVKALRIWDAC
jgi:hypothetical protein